MFSGLGKLLRTWFDRPLYLLIGAQAAYLCVGVLYLQFSISLLSICLAVATAAGAEMLFARKVFFPASAIAAGLGIALFFRASNPLYFIAAACLAVGSKYILRINGKHIFNPSNFGIVLMVFLAPFATTIEFTQWGENFYIYGAIVFISLAVCYRAGAIATTFSFLAAYTWLLTVIVPRYPLIAAHHYGILGPSFVLFASFMITDPQTSPQPFRGRLIHGAAIALTFFSLEILGIRYALFVASFLVTILNVCARFGLDALGEKAAWAPRNLPTLLLVSVLFMFIAGGILRTPPALATSTNFVLFGVESDSLTQCKKNPTFKTLAQSGIGPGSSTLGAAWSDFDGDGYDDLFISSRNGRSTLYRNLHDGTFADITEKAGLPLFTSSSAFFADYDNDGWPDLFVAFQGKADTREWAVANNPSVRVYKNIRGHSFTEVTGTVGLGSFILPDKLGSMSFGDYDNDGHLDFILATGGSSLLLESPQYLALQKSIFDPYFPRPTESICDKEQIRQLLPELQRMTDGDEQSAQLKELLAQAHPCLNVTRGLSLFGGQPGRQTGPLTSVWLHSPGSVHLFENKNGLFTEHKEFWETIKAAYPLEESGQGGINQHPYNRVGHFYWQPISFDYDGDGAQDIFLSIDFGTNLLLHNSGHFVFTDATHAAGVDYYGSGMGAAVGDYNNDGLPDLVVNNLNEDYVYKNNGDGTFTNLLDMNIGALGVGWGVSFLDYNLDGKEDLYLVNGDGVTKTSTDTANMFRMGLARPLFRSDILYKNTGGILTASDDLCSDQQSGVALAVADYNNDGTPDAFVSNIAPQVYAPVPAGGWDRLYENTTAERHYLEVHLTGSASNRMGIGSMVRVTSNNTPQTRWLVLGGSFHSENSQTLLFGFGTSTTPVKVEVTWPSGKKSLLRSVPVDQKIQVTE